jgi:hypothetical protein
MEAVSSDSEVEELVNSGGPELNAIVDGYLPYEAAYRSAVNPSEVFFESSNTSAFPRAALVDWNSAR